jgi:hypothetical protein
MPGGTSNEVLGFIVRMRIRLHHEKSRVTAEFGSYNSVGVMDVIMWGQPPIFTTKKD